MLIFLPSRNLVTYFLCLIFIMFSIGLPAQMPYFQNYGEENGMPSGTIYDMVQDASGYIWYATEYGVSRYDGYRFENFSTEDGLPDDATKYLYKDPEGRIWFLSNTGFLSYYFHDSIRNSELNSQIAEIRGGLHIDKLFIDSLDNIWFSTQSAGTFYVDENKIIKQEYSYHPTANNAYLFFEDLGDDYKLALINLPGTNNSDFIVEDDKYFIRLNGYEPDVDRNFTKVNPGEYFVSYQNVIYHIKEKKIIHKKEFENDIVDLLFDSRNYLWVSEFGKGVSRYDEPDLKLNPSGIPSYLTITDILQDREGSYWFATTTEGVYYVPEFEFWVFPLRNGDYTYRVFSIAAMSNKIYFSTYNNELYYVDLKDNKIYESKMSCD